MRHRDPAFAALWDEALAIGYDRLETLLLQRALEGINDIDVAALTDEGATEDARSPENDADDGIAAKEPRRGRLRPGSGIGPGFARGDVQLALALLNRRDAKGGLRSRGRKLMSSDEVDALLTKKLDALMRRRDKA